MKKHRSQLVILLSFVLLGIVLWFGNTYYNKKRFVQMLAEGQKIWQESTWHSKEKGKAISIAEPLPATSDIFFYDLLWAFTDEAPAFFAGKRLLQGRNEKCFTDIDIDSEDCVVVSQEEMDKIQELRQWYKSNVAEKEKHRQEERDNIKGNQACDDWQAQLPDEYEIIHLWAKGKNQDFGYQIKGGKNASTAQLIEVKINYPKKPAVPNIRQVLI